MIGLNRETEESKDARRSQWHKWFAWFPVVVGEKQMPNGKVRHVKKWMGIVERKGTKCGHWDGPYWSWEYRETREAS